MARNALVRWYQGEGSEADHRASVTIVTKARTHGQWIACDCTGETDPPPLMSAAYLSEAETYYLRRLTSKRQRRPEHARDCPFFREQAPQRFREKRSAEAPIINEPDGLFIAHRLAPEKLAEAPGDAEPDDRSRGVTIPRLARLLWLLMDMAHVTEIEPLSQYEGRKSTMASEFARLRQAAARLEIAPGIALAEHLYTHIEPYERNVVFARLRKAAKTWPEGLAPQAFLVLYANDISGTTLLLGKGKELDLKTRVQYSGSLIGPPYLVLAVVGEHNPRDGYAALRAFAQPVARTYAFVPVHNAYEHKVACELLDLQYQLRKRGITLAFKRPLFDIPSIVGTIRPDFVLDIHDSTTGEIIETALEVIASTDPDYLAVKRQQLKLLSRAGRVITARAATIDSHGTGAILKANLGIG